MPTAFAKMEANAKKLLDAASASGKHISFEYFVQVVEFGRNEARTYFDSYLNELSFRLLRDTVDTEEAFHSWLNSFYAFRSGWRRTKRNEELVDKLGYLSIASLLRRNLPVTFSNVYEHVKGNANITNAALKKWELESGLKATRRQSWIAEVNLNPEARVKQFLEDRRHLGIPIKTQDMIEKLALSRNTILKHASKYLEGVADHLLQINISSDEEFADWMAVFNSYKYFFQNAPRSRELAVCMRRHNIEKIYKEEGSVNFTTIYARVGGTKQYLTDAFEEWEADTGFKRSKPVTWREKTDTPKTTHARDVIFNEFERRKLINLPFTQAELAAELNCSPGTISKYTSIYIDGVAADLLSMTVENDEEYASFLSRFDVFKHFLRNCSKRAPLLSRQLALGIEHLQRNGQPISSSGLTRLTGANSPGVIAALKSWEKTTGGSIQVLSAWKPITLEMVLATVPSALHKLPLTFLESDNLGRKINERQLRMIYCIAQPQLRATAFFIMAFADQNRPNDITFFRTMDRLLVEMNSDLNALDPETFYPDLHSGKIFPECEISKRQTLLTTYFRLLRRQKEYTTKLTLNQFELIKPFLLKEISDRHFWDKSSLHKRIDESRKQRRKQATAAVHEKYYLLRDVADRRTTQLERLHTALQESIECVQNGEALPFKFFIVDDTVSSTGAIRKVTHYLTLWDGPTLRSKHAAEFPNAYKKKSAAAIELYAKEQKYYLSYEGGRSEGAVTSTDDYWFMELLSANVFSQASDKSFLKQHGYPSTAFHSAVLRDWAHTEKWWLDLVSADLNLKFIPIEFLLGIALAGNSAIQIMTKTGARMNEFLQIRLQEDRLAMVKLQDDKEVIAFWAVPKGRSQEEPYYIDEKCMRTLNVWWKYAIRQGQSFSIVKPTYSLESKLSPAAYIWQFNGAHLSHRDVNSHIKFLAHGIDLVTATGKKISVTSHLLRHGFATELRQLNTPLDVVGILLKQKDITITDYYSQPTPSSLVKLQSKIFETRSDLTRTHIRLPKEIKNQVARAFSTIGAVIPVVGGNCTVANQCPAAFACVGCSGNAPDPAKRSQVIEFKGAYEKLAMLAEKQNTPAEIRKYKEIISSCNEMLNEMDLIEAASHAAVEPVTVSKQP